MTAGAGLSRMTASIKGLKGPFMRKAATVLCAILISCASVGGVLTPFGAAFVAAAPRGLCAWAAAGAVIGCFLPIGPSDTLRAVATIVAAAGIRWAVSELKRVNAHPAFSPIAAMTAVVLTGSIVSGSVGARLSYDIVLYAAEGILAAAGAYFMTRAFESLRVGRLYALEHDEAAALIISVCILAVGLSRVEIYGFSIGRAAVLFAMLTAAREKKETGGAIGGVAAGAVLAMSGSGLAMSGMCAIAGLGAGVFANLGTLAAVIAAFVVALLASLASGTVNLFFVGEMLLACIVFRLIPQERFKTVFERLGLTRRTAGTALPGTQVAQRLETAANALRGVSDTVDMVSRRLDRHKPVTVEQLYRQVTESVCAVCPISRHCWENAREQTQMAFELLGEPLQRDGCLSCKTMPMDFRQRCARSAEVMEELNRLYAERLARESAGRRIAQVRSVIGDQLGGVSMMLEDLAEQTAVSDTIDEEAAAAVSEAIHRSGYIVDSVRCVVNSSGRMSITARVSGRRNRCVARNELIYEIEDALGMALEEPEIEGGAEFTITTAQLPALEIEFGASQHCCTGQTLCGDAYEAFIDREGNAVMIISDGMGSGGRAAVDSAMACGLTGRLLRAGFGFVGAMKVVNSALLVKSDDESLATMDIARINLFTGQAGLCKAGAVRSYILRGDAVSCVESQSLPLGILRSIELSEEQIVLDDGDVLIMVSDGVPDEEGWLEEQLHQCEIGDMRTLARELTHRAGKARGEGDDDITVLTARLKAA